MRISIFICTALLTTAAFAQPRAVGLTPITAARVIHRTDGVFFIDFGRDAFAQLTFHLDNVADENLIVRLGEKLADADHVDAKPGGSIRFLQTVVDHGVARLTPADARRMAADVGPVMPFRYVELQGLPAGTSTDAVAKAITQRVASYPFEDSAAEFSCSNEQLNKVWDLCKYSIKATSFAGIFVDGDRERKPYEADAYINGLGWYCCTTDLALPPFTDDYLIQHPTWPTEWSMFSVMCAWNDYLYTGDLSALRKAYPDLKFKSLRALERDDGLISSQHVPPSVNASLHLGKEKLKDIVDWPLKERDGYEMKPINTVVNSFHAHTLKLLAKMAAALGNEAEASDLQSAAQRAKVSLNQKLYNAATGLYIDGEGSTHSSLHANMFPLAFGLVPTERRPAVVAFLKTRGMACSVYGAQFLTDALFDNDAAQDAVAMMLAPGDRSWRHMAFDTGTTLTLEAWDQKYKPNQDWNHAWGAAPANVIPRKILGVEPLAPGFTQALIWPRCATKTSPLTWARGQVPTAHGPLRVDWHTSPTVFHLTIDLPPNTPAHLRLPLDWGDKVTLDHAAVDSVVHAGALELDAPTGRHVITIGQN